MSMSPVRFEPKISAGERPKPYALERATIGTGLASRLLTQKVVFKLIWSYGIDLWGCASKSNIVIMQRSQSKILRATANAPRCVTDHTPHTDFNSPYISGVIHERINKHHNNLEAHPNPILEPLLQAINTRRLKRC
jgi:hypothetical protein